MTKNASSLQRQLKLAAFLLIAGLLVEGFTLYWVNPTSFLLFICVSGALIVLGIMVYLIAIVTA